MTEERKDSVKLDSSNYSMAFDIGVGAICLTLAGTTALSIGHATIAHTKAPPANIRRWQADDVSTKFNRLAAKWKAETDTFDATVTSMILNRSYQRIIALGPEAVPLLLAEYRRQPDHWGWALEILTGENPVPPDDEGDIEAIGAAWISWGRARGLIA